MNKQYILDAVNSLNTSMQEDPKTIHLFDGMYGIGKSWHVQQVISEIKNNKIADGIIQNDKNCICQYLVDFIYELNILEKKNDKLIPVDLNNEDCERIYNKKHFYELVSVLNEKDPSLYEAFTLNNSCKTSSGQILFGLSKNNYDFTEDIEALIKKKGDQRLLLRIEEVVSESLLVDLMTCYFPMDMSKPLDLKSLMPAKPKKIIFVLDNYEQCYASVNSWLVNSFFNYAYEASFSEFISYDMSDTDKRIKINQFFDFRFILSGRDRITQKIFYSNLEKHIDKTKNHNIQVLNENDAEEIFASKKMKIETDLNNMLSISFGLPGLMLLWSEYYILDAVGDDVSIVYNTASLKILEHKTKIEQEWIRCASFLDEFDYYGLRCFPEMNEEYLKVFEYFKHSNELTKINKDENTITLRGEIREIVSRSINSKSVKVNDEYCQIATTYNNARKAYKGLSKKEIEVLRNLAYFKCFDKKYILRHAFDSDYDLAVEFTKNHPDYFEFNEYTISIKKNFLDVLVKFNKRIDLEKFKEKEKFLKEICSNYTKELQSKIIHNDDIIQSLSKDLNDIKVIINPNKRINESLQRQYIKKENKHIELKKKLANMKFKSNTFFSAVNLGLACLVFVIAYFMPDIYEGMGIENQSKTIGALFYGLAGILGVASFIYAFRSFSSKMKKSVRIDNEKKLNEIVSDKKKHYSKMVELRKENEGLSKRMKEIKKELDILRTDNSNCRGKLNQEFM